ncbi:MAG: hypothetical protein ACLTF6_06605 [Clostridium sp.]
MQAVRSPAGDAQGAGGQTPAGDGQGAGDQAPAGDAQGADSKAPQGARCSWRRTERKRSTESTVRRQT